MKIEVLKLARDDLKTIHEYLSDFGENNPKRFRESFEKFCVQVSDMPYMFSQYQYNKAYQKAVIAFDYLIFYRVDKNSDRIKIYRVLHGKRNIDSLLK